MARAVRRLYGTWKATRPLAVQPIAIVGHVTAVGHVVAVDGFHCIDGCLSHGLRRYTSNGWRTTLEHTVRTADNIGVVGEMISS